MRVRLWMFNAVLLQASMKGMNILIPLSAVLFPIPATHQQLIIFALCKQSFFVAMDFLFDT